MVIGTAIMEFITRQGKRLVQEWDVDTYEEDQKDRPDFIGVTIKVGSTVNWNIYFFQ